MNTREKPHTASIKKEILHFLLISYAFAWLVWFPGILATRGVLGNIPWPPLFGIGACGPLVAALWLTKRETGWEGVKDWLKVGFTYQTKPIWWMLILIIPFAVPPLALWLNRIAGGENNPLVVLENPIIILPALMLMLTIGGAQEEYGWRGYALPRMDRILKPWQSDLLMIPLHACWHLPLFVISYTIQSQYSFWLFLAFGIGFTTLIDLIYRRTNHSILAALLFHGLVNTGLEIFPPVGPCVGGSSLPLLIIAGLFGLLALVIGWATSPTKSDQKEGIK